MLEWQRCGGEPGWVQMDFKALVLVKTLVVLRFYQNKSLHYGHSTPTRADRDPSVTTTPTTAEQSSIGVSAETGEVARSNHRVPRNPREPISSSTRIDGLPTLTSRNAIYLVLTPTRTGLTRPPPTRSA
jgi:hypothetical protein